MEEFSNDNFDWTCVQFVHPSSISKHLECPICVIFFHEPYRFPCGHTFCRKCISEFRVIAPQIVVCPECRKEVDLQYVTEDLIADSIISEQLLFCIYKSQLCSWRGKKVDLLEHIEECNFKVKDEEITQIAEKLDQKIKDSVISSSLNQQTQFSTYIVTSYQQSHKIIIHFCKDEKLQENINKNVGESLLVRLMNKDRNMALQIMKQMQSSEGGKLANKQEAPEILDELIEFQQKEGDLKITAGGGEKQSSKGRSRVKCPPSKCQNKVIKKRVSVKKKK